MHSTGPYKSVNFLGNTHHVKTESGCVTLFPRLFSSLQTMRRVLSVHVAIIRLCRQVARGCIVSHVIHCCLINDSLTPSHRESAEAGRGECCVCSQHL
jgi:hypothetical protein